MHATERDKPEVREKRKDFRKKVSHIDPRRLKIIDRKWTGTAGDQARRLEDEGATIEDLDAQGGFEMPLYDRGLQPANMPIAPGAPQPNTNTKR